MPCTYNGLALQARCYVVNGPVKPRLAAQSAAQEKPMHPLEAYLREVSDIRNEKWLSYRDVKLLGRPLSPDEAREVSDMARRIAAIVLLETELDANYAAVRAAAYVWPGA